MANAMAAGPPATKRGPIWHTRATWSTRQDRRAFVVWLALIWLGIIAGFGVDMPHFLHQAPPAPTVDYFHAAAFTIWLLLLTIQVLLVTGDRVAVHRRLGWFLAGWACLMAVLGPWAAFATQTVSIPGPEYNPPFLAIQLGEIIAFLALLAWGISLRKNSAAHKRIMMLSTIALVDAGYNRFIGWLWPAHPHSMLLWFVYVFYGSVLLVALMAAWDWSRGRLMKQFVIGAVALVAWECLIDILYHWAPWKVFTTALLAAWANHFH